MRPVFNRSRAFNTENTVSLYVSLVLAVLEVGILVIHNGN